MPHDYEYEHMSDYNYEIDLVEGDEGNIPKYTESFKRLEQALEKAISLLEKGENEWRCEILSTISGATLFTLEKHIGMVIIKTEGSL